MTKENTTIYWTAENNSSFLNGYREAKTMRAAVRDARHYLRNELIGEGTIRYFTDIEDAPVRVDEKSLQTGYKWVTRTGNEI
jgi:hypothetical protein